MGIWLDRLGQYRYMTALVFGVWLALAAPASAAGQLLVKGAVLPPGSLQVGEDRYKSPSNYKDTLTWLEKQYRSNPRKTIVNQPGIRGIHIVNDGRGEWEGLNVYELEGETRIFVVPREPPEKEPRVDNRSR